MTDAKSKIVDLDFDHAIEGNVFTPLGTQVAEQFNNAYVEVSPSGTGLRVFVLGTVTPSGSAAAACSYTLPGARGWLRMTGAVVKRTAAVVGPCQTGLDWAVGPRGRCTVIG